MRDTAAFNRNLHLEGVKVTEVDVGDDTVTVTVRRQRRKRACPACGFTTWSRYDARPVASSWRHLRLGTWRRGDATQPE